MSDTLATEAKPSDDKAAHPGLERLATNERMRHVMTAEWMVRKLDDDLRRRLDVVLAPLADLGSGDPRRESADGALVSLARSLERLCEAAKPHSGTPHPPHDPVARVRAALNNAVSASRGVDASSFGRRAPFHNFDRSKSEPVYGCMLSVLSHYDRLVEAVRTIDNSIDEPLHAHLVTLQKPLDPRPMA